MNLEKDKVIKMFLKYRNHFNKEQIITLSKTILSLQQQEQKEQESLQVQVDLLKKDVEKLKRKEFTTLNPPSQVINIQNANIQMSGPPKRMNIQNANIDFTDPSQEKMAPSYKIVIAEMKKVFKPTECNNLKPSQIIDANEMEEVKE